MTFDWYKSTVASQYANSPQMMDSLEYFAQAVDQEQNIDDFWNKVWNVLTAEGYGLDVWGRIVCVTRNITLPTQFFGFDQMGGQWIDPFNVSPFYKGQNLGEKTYSMPDETYRKVILAKALANINAGTIPSLNKVLQLLFPGRGKCYVTDPGDMTMTYVFEFETTAVEKSIVIYLDVFQKPSGVKRVLSFVGG